MIIKGLKFQFLVSETLARARYIIYYFSSHNNVLLSKCVHLVYEMIKYDLNRCLFSLMFSDMIHAYENFKNKYLASSKFKSP